MPPVSARSSFKKVSCHEQFSNFCDLFLVKNSEIRGIFHLPSTELGALKIRLKYRVPLCLYVPPSCLLSHVPVPTSLRILDSLEYWPRNNGNTDGKEVKCCRIRIRKPRYWKRRSYSKSKSIKNSIFLTLFSCHTLSSFVLNSSPVSQITYAKNLNNFYSPYSSHLG